MYGLVNSAIRALVIELKGEPDWLRVCAEAGIDQTSFVSLRAYPDDITYALVGSVARNLSLRPEEVLREFGRFFIGFTAKHGHQDLFASYPKGRDGLIRFINELDDMHARIMIAMPDLVPPQVAAELSGEILTVHYGSKRKGLEPMVVGLLDGLLEHFECRGLVTQELSEIRGNETYGRFQVQFQS